MGSLWAVPELSGDFLCSFLVTLMVWEHFYTVHDLHLAQIRLTAEHAILVINAADNNDKTTKMALPLRNAKGGKSENIQFSFKENVIS